MSCVDLSSSGVGTSYEMWFERLFCFLRDDWFFTLGSGPLQVMYRVNYGFPISIDLRRL
jgi:hypothetical protein